MNDLRRQIAALGDAITPANAAASGELLAGAHERPPYTGVRVTRDLRYGDHPRHRLDVFAPAAADEPAPVVVFVHGGNFVAGDKTSAGSPYYDNVGLWAARAGLVGVTITYRLAPEHRWPAGAEDVEAAIAWLRAHAREHGDGERIVLVGASAGGTHVADYVARGGNGVRGVALLSAVVDLPAIAHGDVLAPYYGDDPAAWAAASPLGGLVDARIPVLAVVAEHDPPGHHRQAAALARALLERDGRLPELVVLPEHNHFTEVFSLNTGDRRLGDRLLDFTRRTT